MFSRLSTTDDDSDFTNSFEFLRGLLAHQEEEKLQKRLEKADAKIQGLHISSSRTNGTTSTVSFYYSMQYSFYLGHSKLKEHRILLNFILNYIAKKPYCNLTYVIITRA